MSKTGGPISSKTFRTKRDASDRARTVGDEPVRGVFTHRADCHQVSSKVARPVSRTFGLASHTRKFRAGFGSYVSVLRWP